jgi:ribosomal protein RSM22 (predicted rRNA methylase)
MAFVPAKDFQLSNRFYEDIGFTKTLAIDNATQFVMQDYGFWLQDYYVETWAENSNGGVAKVLSAPHAQEGGVMMQFCDPSGVLWHVREVAQPM